MAIAQGLESIGDLIAANITKIASAIATIIIGVIAAYVVRSSMRRTIGTRIPPYIYRPVENLVFYSILILAGILSLYPFGLSLSSLLVAGGFAGIIVGLAAQSSLGNIISGVFLVVEQPLRVGDPVMIGDIAGEVVDVRVLSTLIRTWDGYLVRIPNQTVFNSIITNYSRTKARRIDFIVGVHYKTDVEKAIKIIIGYLDSNPYCLVNPSPEVFVDSYGDSSVNIRIRCWTPTKLWYPARIKLQTELKRILEENGILIPYPQLDLHVKSIEPVIRIELKNQEEKNLKR
ncbi:MAG: mechanosensitive ion channel family protein [Desulfurococcales archaeon]|nr:mechanosensitive ion channel family protein [Desulfurococcales archaeon]